MAGGTFEVSIGGATYQVDAPDENTAWAWANQAHTEAQAKPSAPPAPPPPNPAIAEGRALPGAVQGLANVMQGPTLGFGDEIAGAVGALGHKLFGNDKPFAENYRSIRDTTRSASDAAAERNPIFSMVTKLAASAPLAILGGGAATPTLKSVGALASALRAGGQGAGYGAVGGAGESNADSLEGLVTDTVKGGAMGAAGGGVGSLGVSGIGAGVSNVAQRVAATPRYDAARVKLAEAIRRSVDDGVDPIARTQSRLRSLGPEATLADAGGVEARRLADTLATLPGKAKGVAERLIARRQSSRSSRLITAADEALGTQSANYSQSLEALARAKATASKPFYTQLEGVSVRTDPELDSLLRATREAHWMAEKSAVRRQELPIDLTLVKEGDDVPFLALDKVKQALWDLAEGAKREGHNGAAADFTALRRKLTDKLDRMSPKDKSGGSIYAQARDAFAGPAQLESAVTAGRGAMKTDAIGVADLMKGMGASELEAFRIGALQSLRDKLGTESGATSLLKMWKEPGTSGKLKEIFGSDYRRFAADVARESRLKLLEQAGRGSQTASRLHAIGDLDEVPAVIGAATAAASGSPVAAAGVLPAALRAWNKVETPEATRNEMARMLMTRERTGSPYSPSRVLQELPGYIGNMNAERTQRSALAAELAAQLQRKNEEY